MGPCLQSLRNTLFEAQHRGPDLEMDPPSFFGWALAHFFSENLPGKVLRTKKIIDAGLRVEAAAATERASSGGDVRAHSLAAVVEEEVVEEEEDGTTLRFSFAAAAVAVSADLAL